MFIKYSFGVLIILLVKVDAKEHNKTIIPVRSKILIQDLIVGEDTSIALEISLYFNSCAVLAVIKTLEQKKKY